MVQSSALSAEPALWPGGGIQLICWVLVPQQCDWMNERSDGEGGPGRLVRRTNELGASGPKITRRAAPALVSPGRGPSGRVNQAGRRAVYRFRMKRHTDLCPQ